MNRLERVRAKVDAILRGQRDEEERRAGFVHLYGVSAMSALLAARRGLDVELCATAGMLHDLSSYETGDPANHARESALLAARLLGEMEAYSEAEVAAVSEAITLHSAKGQTDGPLAELLKDADVLQHYLYNPVLRDDPARTPRLQSLLAELRVSGPPP